jgi:nicotinamidase-related amidase/type 1 glutamine amidotransferase
VHASAISAVLVEPLIVARHNAGAVTLVSWNSWKSSDFAGGHSPPDVAPPKLRCAVMSRIWRGLLVGVIFAGFLSAEEVTSVPPPTGVAEAEPFHLRLRTQIETSPGSERYHTLVRREAWLPRETAFIVCDVWDSHHSEEAVKRVLEIAPRLNEVLHIVRDRGVTIIHAPSACMQSYEGHPGRVRAMETPKAAVLPPEIETWCYKIPSEEQGVYPVDQSDGGEDDEPVAHEKWLASLAAQGLNPRAPWTKQIELLDIDAERDFISDKGDEVWSILEARGIKNVIIAGVHTNMCVLGRPFGLRRMASNGKNVVLMRDLTDTMYNPESWPYVSHYTGTDFIISPIEKYVCPTITSDQFTGGEPVRFIRDTRPHVAIVMAEDEYRTEVSLPKFAAENLGKEYRVSYVFGSDAERNSIPGLEVLDEADILVVSIRRRVLPEAQMQYVRDFIDAGKPVIGIRTASHAFSLREEAPGEGLVAWPEFDAQVFGGNYTGHHGNEVTSTVTIVPRPGPHALLDDLQPQFEQQGSLYKTAPLATGAELILEGTLNDGDDGEATTEPVVWTYRRADGGWSFYTSLGDERDFAAGQLPILLKNAIDWAAATRTATAGGVEASPAQ